VEDALGRREGPVVRVGLVCHCQGRVGFGRWGVPVVFGGWGWRSFKFPPIGVSSCHGNWGDLFAFLVNG